MILQIITLLVLILALMSPFLIGTGFGTNHAAIVIDNSASMSCLYSGDESGLERAKAEAISYVHSLKPGTGISLIISSNTATLLVSNTDDKSTVIDKIKTIECSTLPGDATAGVEMVKSMQSQWDSVETVVLTDTYTSLEGVDGYIVDLYAPTENVGIEYVSHGSTGGKETVLCKVTNYGETAQARDVSLYQGDDLLEIKSISLDPGKSATVYFDSNDITFGAVRVELNLNDSLALDNVCYDVVEESKDAKILLMTEDNVFIEKALLQLDNITVMKSSEIENFDSYVKGDYDLYIFDGMMPENLPERGDMLIFDVVYPDLFQMDDYLDGVYVEPVKHNVTRYADNLTFGVGSTFTYQVPVWADPILTAKGSSSDVIGFFGNTGGRNICVLGFDVHETDLPLKMEFPILMYNIIDECVSTGDLSNVNINCGDSVDINCSIEGGVPVVLRPDETETELSDYRATYTDTQTPGIYTLVQSGVKGEQFAVNFPKTESKIKDIASNISLEGQTDVKNEVVGTFSLRNLIILIALGLLVVEWIAYLRR